MAAIESRKQRAQGPESLLTLAAKTVGHAAGQAAKAIGLEHADSKVHTAHGLKTMGRKAPKRMSARLRRKDEATELKAKAASDLPKGSAELGAPYRRVMGKPAANWTVKDIDYIRGLIANA